MTKVRGAEYLLDGYPTLGSPETITKNGIEYTVQRFQGKHKNEYLLRSPTGDVYLYENNVLKQKWQENENEERSEEFFALKNGRIDFRMRFDDILKQLNFNKIVNHKKGLRMEIWSSQTGNLKYHGEFNERRQKEGWGIEFDNENRQMGVEGIWSKGTLTEIIRLFNGDTMTELKRNGKNSLDPFKRIPIYVGGFRYDEDSETFYREGKGCLIDEDSKAAKREGEWKDGREISGVDLSAGWYCKNKPNQAPNQAKSEVSVETIPKKDLRSKGELTKDKLCRPDSASIVKKGKTTVRNMNELSSLSLSVTDLVISPYCCNTVTALDLNRLESLETIEIGDHCFASV